MTKENYIKIRDKEEFPLSLMYEYWNEVKPSNYKNLSLDEFEKQFGAFIMQFNGTPVNTPNGIKVVTYPNIVDKVYTYFNNKFNI